MFKINTSLSLKKIVSVFKERFDNFLWFRIKLEDQYIDGYISLGKNVFK